MPSIRDFMRKSLIIPAVVIQEVVIKILLWYDLSVWKSTTFSFLTEVLKLMIKTIIFCSYTQKDAFQYINICICIIAKTCYPVSLIQLGIFVKIQILTKKKGLCMFLINQFDILFCHFHCKCYYFHSSTMLKLQANFYDITVHDI